MVSYSTPELHLFLQRLDAFVRSSSSNTKQLEQIWLNYRILEAEIARLHVE